MEESKFTGTLIFQTSQFIVFNNTAVIIRRSLILLFFPSLKASAVQTQLLEIEPEYKANLLNAVEVYKETMVVFVSDYDEKYAMSLMNFLVKTKRFIVFLQYPLEVLWFWVHYPTKQVIDYKSFKPALMNCGENIKHTQVNVV